MRYTLLLFLFLLPLSAQQSANDTFDAYALKQQLSPASNSMKDVVVSQFALGYVLGVAEATDVVAGIPAGAKYWRFCLPTGYRQGEISEVVLKYLNDHPEKLHLQRSNVTLDALREAYPCHLATGSSSPTSQR